ncbi:MAG: sigma-70 family RNA polymerase sigma factor [Gemmataceae bacterium]
MSDVSQFRELIARVRAGDQAAATALVKEYEPEVRRFVRVKLTDPHLRQFLDSADICQSVLAAFFVRAMAGQFDLAEPADLVRLLTAMARNRIIDHARRPAAARPPVVGPEVWAVIPARGETPSQVASFQELVVEALKRLSPEERQLADRRAAGTSWQEVADEFGVPADTARKRLERALDRVCADLGIDAVGDG